VRLYTRYFVIPKLTVAFRKYFGPWLLVIRFNCSKASFESLPITLIGGLEVGLPD
jgi:hypothetical protein